MLKHESEKKMKYKVGDKVKNNLGQELKVIWVDCDDKNTDFLYLCLQIGFSHPYWYQESSLILIKPAPHEYKTGDWVWVRGDDSEEWIKCIYLYSDPYRIDNKHCCVSPFSENDFKKGDKDDVVTVFWNQIKPYTEPETKEEKIEQLINEIPVCADGKEKIKQLVELVRGEG